MRQLDPARIDPNELEGRAGHRGLRTGAASESADKGGLARPKRTGQQEQVAGLELAPELLPFRLGLGGAGGDELTQSGRSHAGSAPSRHRS